MTLSFYTDAYRLSHLACDGVNSSMYTIPCQPILWHQPLHIYYGRYLPTELLIETCKMSETPIKTANFGVLLSVHLSDYMKQQPIGLIQQSAYNKQQQQVVFILLLWQRWSA